MTTVSFFRLLTISSISITLGLGACKQHTDEDTQVYLSEAERAELLATICLTQDADNGYAISETPEAKAMDRAAGLKNKFWEPGKTLRVRFLNGSTTLQNKVFAYAEQWENFANINLVKVSSGVAEIRVLFSSNGHWSYLGTDNLGIPASERTMNLNFTNNTPESQLRGTTLHEFGHAIGLSHEQQQPLANIPWNIPAVYAFYMGAPNFWDKAKIDQNVLNKTDWLGSQHTEYDTKSIMQYPVSASLTTNGFSIPENTILSAKDKEFVGKMYSTKRIRVRHAVNTSVTITFWLNGIYHTLKPGESLWVSAQTSGNQLFIWECPAGSCGWDGYQPTYGYHYKIVAAGNNGNFTLAYD